MRVLVMTASSASAVYTRSRFMEAQVDGLEDANRKRDVQALLMLIVITYFQFPASYAHIKRRPK